MFSILLLPTIGHTDNQREGKSMIKNNKATDGKKKSKLKLVVIALVVICVAAGLGSGN